MVAESYKVKYLVHIHELVTQDLNYHKLTKSDINQNDLIKRDIIQNEIMKYQDSIQNELLSDIVFS